MHKMSEENALVLIASLQSSLKDKGSKLVSYLIKSEKLRLLVVDELHLCYHFSRSFRRELADLKEKLFLPLQNQRVPQLYLTATCSKSIKNGCEKLFGMKINQMRWPSVSDIANRKQAMSAICTNRSLHHVKESIKSILAEPKIHDEEILPNKIITHANQRSKAIEFAKRLEDVLDGIDDSWKNDVLILHGKLTKEDKTYIIRNFVDRNTNNSSSNILVAASGVGNAGSDSKDIRAVFRIDIPPTICDLVQEMGRVGRRLNVSSENCTHQIHFQLADIVCVWKRIDNPNEKCIDDACRFEQKQELLKAMKMSCDQSLCHKTSIEMELGNPHELNRTPKPACGCCSNCLTNHALLESCKEGVQLAIFNVFVAGENKIEGSTTIEAIVESIRECPDAQKHLFSIKSKKAPTSGQINEMSFVLIANKIIGMKHVMKHDHATFHPRKNSENSIHLCLMR